MLKYYGHPRRGLETRIAMSGGATAAAKAPVPRDGGESLDSVAQGFVDNLGKLVAAAKGNKRKQLALAAELYGGSTTTQIRCVWELHGCAKPVLALLIVQRRAEGAFSTLDSQRLTSYPPPPLPPPPPHLVSRNALPRLAPSRNAL